MSQRLHAVQGAWDAFERAYAEDPEGVAAVLEQARPYAEPEELAWVIQRESGWRPTERNPGTDAAGLIQWMPRTRKALGMPDPMPTTLKGQAPWVRLYLQKVGRPIPPGDVYLAIFNPRHVGAPDDTVLYPPGSNGWRWNPSLRDGPEGPITAGSVRRAGTPPGRDPRVVVRSRAPGNVRRPGGTRTRPGRSPGVSPWLLLAALWYFSKRRA